MSIMSRASSVAIVLGLLLSGCGSVPTTEHYLLAGPGASSVPDTNGDGPILRVSELGAALPYGDDRLVYRIAESSEDDPQSVGFYEQHRWAAPPAVLVTEALLEGLRATPGLAAVEPGDWRPGSYALGGRILWLEELDLPSGPTARVGLDLTLHDPEGNILWQHRFTAERSGSTQEVAEVVEMLREALGEVVGEARSAVVEATTGGAN